MLLVMSNRRDAVARWREILWRQAGSGLSVAAFCRRSRIPQASFYAWRRKLRNAPAFTQDAPALTEDAAAFTEVCVAPESGPVTRGLQLVLSGGRSIMVRPGFDRATLLALVEALERGTVGGSDEESGA